ncbi:MAG: TIGR02147 family protein [Pseudobdellovibrionaceae bacterium]
MKRKTQKAPPSPHIVLGRAFKRLIQKNSKFSLRRLAQLVEVSPSHLSRILNGKKKIPVNKLELFINALQMDIAQSQILKQSIFWNQVKEKNPNNVFSDILENSDSAVLSPLIDYEELGTKEFNIMEQWYNIAILDLSTCTDFKDDPRWIAKRLSITPVQTLLKAEALQLKNGRYEKTNKKLRVPTNKALPAIRQFHRSMIQKGLWTMENQQDAESYKQRLITGITMAINPENLERAKERLMAAIHEASEILTEGPCTEVYQINLQLFGLTVPVKNNSTYESQELETQLPFSKRSKQ